MSWLEDAVLHSHEECPGELKGWVVGRGLPTSLFHEMKIGCWIPPRTESGDTKFDVKNGPRGSFREDWMVIPYWSPRGDILGAEFRTWGQEGKRVRDYRNARSFLCPTYIGMSPQALERVWQGGDLWLVEGVFDLAVAHAAPSGDTVLACGTARLSRNQLNFIKRFLKKDSCVHVMFDEDETGRQQVTGFVNKETGKRIPGVLERLQRAGVTAREVRYRGGKDPGEIWERGGKSAINKAIGR